MDAMLDLVHSEDVLFSVRLAGYYLAVWLVLTVVFRSVKVQSIPELADRLILADRRHRLMLAGYVV